MADDDDHQAQGKSWNINHYILAGLCATLVVTAVITVTSIVLSPAQVTFSVAHATRKMLPNVTDLNVTIAVYNPSHRCQARYQSVSISLKNSSTGAGRFFIQANVVPVNIFPLDYVRGPNETLVNYSILLVEQDQDRAYGFGHRLNSSAGLTVEVTAQVRFKIGVTPTRLYDMKVFCPGVFFTDVHDNYSSAAHDAIQHNFNCSG